MIKTSRNIIIEWVYFIGCAEIIFNYIFSNSIIIFNYSGGKSQHKFIVFLKDWEEVSEISKTLALL